MGRMITRGMNLEEIANVLREDLRKEIIPKVRAYRPLLNQKVRTEINRFPSGVDTHEFNSRNSWTVVFFAPSRNEWFRQKPENALYYCAVEWGKGKFLYMFSLMDTGEEVLFIFPIHFFRRFRERYLAKFDKKKEQWIAEDAQWQAELASEQVQKEQGKKKNALLFSQKGKDMDSLKNSSSNIYDMGLRKRFMKNNFIFIYGLQDRSPKFEVGAFIYGASLEGIALGRVLARNAFIFKTFISYDMAKGEQVSYETQERVRCEKAMIEFRSTGKVTNMLAIERCRKQQEEKERKKWQEMQEMRVFGNPLYLQGDTCDTVPLETDDQGTLLHFWKRGTRYHGAIPESIPKGISEKEFAAHKAAIVLKKSRKEEAKSKRQIKYLLLVATLLVIICIIKSIITDV